MQYSTNLYDVDFGYTTGNGNEMHCEIRVGLKENYYNDIDLEFCYVDSQGNRSNFYCYKLFEAQQITSQAIKTTAAHSSEKTTKEKKTTKKTTGKSTASKYNTKKYTTKSSSGSGGKTNGTYSSDVSYNEADAGDDVEYETKIVSAEPMKSESSAEKYIIIASSAVLLVGAGAILVMITGNRKK
ncbi:hypothetical protein SDC9_148086 [bioreactor metagenome]|uniref:Uncharacterized protein n=1 Tax=bioreactor metagenome TaxID=1076179 RepID=A0A645EFW8_9ZZZZ